MSMGVSFNPMAPVQAVQAARTAQRDDDDRVAARAAQAKSDDEAREAQASEPAKRDENAASGSTSSHAVDITA